MNNLNKPMNNEQIELPYFQAEVLDMADIPASNQPTFKDETKEFLSLFHESTLVKKVHEGIRDCHKSASSEMVESMILVGRSGNGKTTICKKYAENYGRNESGGKMSIPVIYISLPPNANLGDLSIAILEQISNKLNFTGKVSVLRKKAFNLLRLVNTKLIIIDEAQRLNHENNWYKPQDALEFIADCQDSLKIPFVLCGTPELLELTKIEIENKMTSSFEPFIIRTRQSRTIPSIKYSGKAWEKTFNKLKADLPRTIEPSIQELSARVFIATDGRIGFILKLFKEVIEISSIEEPIDLKKLAEAYERITSTKLCEFNPFTAGASTIRSHINKIVIVKECS